MKLQPMELVSSVLGSLGSNPFVLLAYFVTSCFYLSGPQVPCVKGNPGFGQLS